MFVVANNGGRPTIAWIRLNGTQLQTTIKRMVRYPDLCSLV
jgi:hypothetical protein